LRHLLAVDEPRLVSARRLPNSAREVAAVGARFESSRVLSGESATLQGVLQWMQNYAVLHFSCHGRARLDQLLESGLVLAHDQVLTLCAIMDLRLQGARLAVLLACETGLPQLDPPDEAISLPTGLVQVGVPGVVALLWPVSDQSTSVLMGRFYELWKGRGMCLDEALRQAQLCTRDVPGAVL